MRKTSLFKCIVAMGVLLGTTAAANAQATSGSCGTNATWSYNTTTKVLTISGTGAMTNYSSGTNAPWSSYRSQITSVSIASGVTTIGMYAFSGCSGLTSVTIPNSVTSIGMSAFSGCSGLTSVTIPNSVTSIELSAFSGCSGLTSITIPNSVTSIDYGVFTYCSGLMSINIPNSVTSIGGSAFYGCSGLTSVTIPNSVTSIGNGVFAYCSGLTSVTIPNSVTSIEHSAFLYSGLTSVTIPNSVTSISEQAFAYCSGLTTVTIGNSVTSIDYGVFANCTSLTAVTIGNSVTSIDYGVFENCTSLTAIDVATANTTYSSVGGVLFNNAQTTLIQYPTGKQGAYTIPNSVTAIGYNAFKNCRGLTSVTIPEAVVSIDYAAFAECRGLTSIYANCSTPPILGDNVFNNVNTNTCTLYVPSGSESAYRVALQWNDFMDAVGTCGTNCMWSYDAPTTTLTISGTGAMYNYSYTSCGTDCYLTTAPWAQYYAQMTSVIIESGVTSIGNEAFDGCIGLTNVTIGNSVTSIGNDAFYNCSGLTSITIPNSVTSIGDYTFEGCSELTSITIGNSVTSIGEEAFYECTNLTSIYINRSTPPTLSSNVFYNVNTNACTLYVPSGAAAAYGGTTQWEDFTNIVATSFYTLTFDAQGGTAVATQDIAQGAKATLPNPAPTKTDYTFEGWYRNAECTGTAWNFATDVITGNITLYAKWVNAVSTVVVTGVSLSTTTLSLALNATQQLTATITPSNATNKNVTWSSSNTSIATVAADGRVTAKAAGTANITVTTQDGSKTATCAVTVTAASIAVTGVAVSPVTLSLTPNATQQLTATITPSNATNKAVTWSSNNSAVATVANGLVTAVSAGSATIIATTQDGGFTASCTVTVTATATGVAVTGVSVSPTTLSLAPNATQQLTATITPSNATNKNVTWASSNTSIATVAADGRVTAKASGTATITVTTQDGSKTATCAVTVTVAGALSNNANLSSLSVTGYNISLEFGVYTLTLPNNVSTITINATAADSKAQVIGAGVKPINVGSNEFAIVVTAEDGTQKVYTIIVTRLVVTAVATQSVEPLQIYPNPASDQITVSSDQWNAGDKVEIYNVNGGLVLSVPSTGSGTSSTINIGHLPAGVYIVRVGTKVAKVVKQ